MEILIQEFIWVGGPPPQYLREIIACSERNYTYRYVINAAAVIYHLLNHPGYAAVPPTNNRSYTLFVFLLCSFHCLKSFVS